MTSSRQSPKRSACRFGVAFDQLQLTELPISYICLPLLKGKATASLPFHFWR
ncbi:Uncharacterised protein [Segatella copri]|nr:Uncharacterised protein [Segatella copri]